MASWVSDGLNVLGAAVVVFGALWAVAKWLLGPRLQREIRAALGPELRALKAMEGHAERLEGLESRLADAEAQVREHDRLHDTVHRLGEDVRKSLQLQETTALQVGQLAVGMAEIRGKLSVFPNPGGGQ